MPQFFETHNISSSLAKNISNVFIQKQSHSFSPLIESLQIGKACLADLMQVLRVKNSIFNTLRIHLPEYDQYFFPELKPHLCYINTEINSQPLFHQENKSKKRYKPQEDRHLLEYVCRSFLSILGLEDPKKEI